MKTPPLFLFLPLLFSLCSHGYAQLAQPDTPQQQITVSLRPSIAVVIGICSIMFSLTFLLLIYAKFCRTAADGDLFGRDPENQHEQGRTNGLLAPGSRFSGIDKTVIESLPFFRFSSLKGAREGLECAVCLSKFDDAEILRLLPKCKHAFHMDCVQRWLENHSSCPLCRCKVEIEDLTLFKYSTSSRFLFRNSSVPREETDFELYVERESTADDRRPSSRFAWGGSVRKTSEKRKKEALLLPEGGDGGQFLHEQKHKIIVSGVVFKNRWSDVNSSDLISLKSEMLNLASSNRFSATDASSEWFTAKNSAPESRSSADETIRRIKEEMEKKRTVESKASQLNCGLPAPAASAPSSSDAGTDDMKNHSLTKSMIPSGNNNRCMSEIVNISRFDEVLTGRGSRGPASADCLNSGDNTKDEKVRRVWLTIARRTVQWFAGREKRPETHHTGPGTPTSEIDPQLIWEHLNGPFF